MFAFDYHRASSVQDARQAFSARTDPRYLAGGQTLLASLKMRLAQPDALIDLGRVAELKRIARSSQGQLQIGAMATHAEVEASREVRAAIPSLAALAGGIGDRMVRHQGTMGGSLANNDPAADWPAALLALKGVVVTDQRRIEAADFLVDLFTTALEPGELILSVELQPPTRGAYVKFKHPASRFALVGVYVADHGGDVRVAVTGAGACAFRSASLEQALTREFSAASALATEIDSAGLNNDLQATPAYRAQLIRVMASRAVVQLAP